MKITRKYEIPNEMLILWIYCSLQFYEIHRKTFFHVFGVAMKNQWYPEGPWKTTEMLTVHREKPGNFQCFYMLDAKHDIVWNWVRAQELL